MVGESAKLRVGVVGCGNVSDMYFSNAAEFADYEITACASLRNNSARAQAKRYGILAMSVDNLLADPQIDIVMNLTVPTAHADISVRALKAGKHVYSEKPLATNLADAKKILETAERLGLCVGCAPDTILGPGIQRVKLLMAQQAIGKPILGLATVLSHGMEHWHPNPEFFYQQGGGPILDLGPYYISALVAILGPIATVRSTALVGNATREISAEGPAEGTRFTVNTPTTVNSLMTFANGAEIVLMASWDVWKTEAKPMEIHGQEGSISVPDPNWFGGEIRLARRDRPWEIISTERTLFGKPNFEFLGDFYPNYRGLGLAEMASAIRKGGSYQCSGELGYHVLEVMLGILKSAEDGTVIRLESRFPVLEPSSSIGEELVLDGSRLLSGG